MVGPAALSVFHHRVAAVAEAMGATLQRAAYSPNIKERRDYSCAVFDNEGLLLAQAAHIPVHLGALPASVAAVMAHVAHWAPGDVYMLNDPFLGGSHLPDITSISAVHVAPSRPPSAFLVTRAHHADVGGGAPGSLPLARDLYGEGLVIPPLRLACGGAVDGNVVSLICANSRTPHERRGDLEAQLAAHVVGERRIREVIGDSPGGFRSAGRALCRYAERMMRTRLSELPHGTYRFRDEMDDDGAGSEHLTICVTITIDGDRLAVDFSGTAPQTVGPINAPLSVTTAAVYYVVACLAGDMPINGGTFAPVTVAAPDGCLVNPRRPAAVGAGNVETSQRLVDALLGALATAAPALVPAASQGTMNNVMIGGFDPFRERPFSYYETMGGGAGAGPNAEGAPGRHVHMTNTRNTPVEALEAAYPLRVTAYRLRPGTGGRGRHDGGSGVERRLRCLVPAWVTLISERRRSAPWGLAGGHSGSRGEDLVLSAGRERRLPAKSTFLVAAGDEVVIRSPGGGAWGAPESGA